MARMVACPPSRVITSGATGAGGPSMATSVSNRIPSGDRRRRAGGNLRLRRGLPGGLCRPRRCAQNKRTKGDTDDGCSHERCGSSHTQTGRGTVDMAAARRLRAAAVPGIAAGRPPGCGSGPPRVLTPPAPGCRLGSPQKSLEEETHEGVRTTRSTRLRGPGHRHRRGRHHAGQGRPDRLDGGSGAGVPRLADAGAALGRDVSVRQRRPLRLALHPPRAQGRAAQDDERAAEEGRAGPSWRPA